MALTIIIRTRFREYGPSNDYSYPVSWVPGVVIITTRFREYYCAGARCMPGAERVPVSTELLEVPKVGLCVGQRDRLSWVSETALACAEACGTNIFDTHTHSHIHKPARAHARARTHAARSRTHMDVTLTCALLLTREQKPVLPCAPLCLACVSMRASSPLLHGTVIRIFKFLYSYC